MTILHFPFFYILFSFLKRVSDVFVIYCPIHFSGSLPNFCTSSPEEHFSSNSIGISSSQLSGPIHSKNLQSDGLKRDHLDGHELFPDRLLRDENALCPDCKLDIEPLKWEKKTSSSCLSYDSLLNFSSNALAPTCSPKNLTFRKNTLLELCVELTYLRDPIDGH